MASSRSDPSLDGEKNYAADATDEVITHFNYGVSKEDLPYFKDYLKGIRGAFRKRVLKFYYVSHKFCSSG